MSRKIGLGDVHFDPDIDGEIDFEFFGDSCVGGVPPEDDSRTVAADDRNKQTSDLESTAVNYAPVLVNKSEPIDINTGKRGFRSLMKENGVEERTERELNALLRDNSSENGSATHDMSHREGLLSYSCRSETVEPIDADNGLMPSSKDLLRVAVSERSSGSPTLSSDSSSDSDLYSVTDDSLEDYDEDSGSEITDVSPLSSANMSPLPESPKKTQEPKNTNNIISPKFGLMGPRLQCRKELMKLQFQATKMAETVTDNATKKRGGGDTVDLKLLTKAILELEDERKRNSTISPSLASSSFDGGAGRASYGRTRRNMTFTNDEVRRIENENKRLLQRIIDSQKSRKATTTMTQPKVASSAVNRIRELKKIEVENLGKAATALRTIHSEQLTKLQTKHQQECDLLEDIRNFSKQRATIEKNYGEALLKLSTSLLQHKIPSIQTVASEDGKERKTVYGVWRMVLDENEKLAKARLAAAEVFQQQISENAKLVRAQKMQVSKKCLEQLQKIHEEMQLGVRELDKTKKAYGDEEHVAHEARDRAHDAEEKLKRKKGHFFQSLTSLQKNSAKFSSKKEACDVRSTGARNEYLLTLAATNAHQARYNEVDLPEIMKTMDAEVYEKVAEYFQLLSQTELFTCAATHSSFTIVKEFADLITRQFNVQCYMTEWTALKCKINYSFEACEGDKIDFVSSEHNSGLNLNKEGKRWAIRIAKENKAMREHSRQLRCLLHQSSSGQKDEASGEQSLIDVEQKIEELRQNIRKCETNKIKAEARLELLQQAGVNSDEWLKSGDGDTLGPYDMTGGGLSRAGSTLSVKTDISGNIDDGSSEFYDSDYNDDISDTSPSAHAMKTSSYRDGDDTQSEPQDTSSLAGDGVSSTAINDGTSETGPAGVGAEGETTSLGFTPMRCLALYNYTAQNADELSIIEQEVLDVIGEGDGDGWVKARNSEGVEGYVPQSYVEIEGGESIPSSIYPAPTSFSSVDYTMPDWGDEGVADGEVAEEAIGPDSVSPPLSSIDTNPIIVENHVEIDGQSLCRAVYDYEATCPEELTFVEGQIIRIISKHVHDVDDGWWEGTVDGQVGIFPSLVVEELRSDGEPQSPEVNEEEELMSPPGSAPPTFAPPPMPQFLSAPAQVIITQPTPEVDNPNEIEIENNDQSQQDGPASYSYTTPDFDMELTEEQQSQYETQFSGTTDSNANETAMEGKEEEEEEEEEMHTEKGRGDDGESPQLPDSSSDIPDLVASAVGENVTADPPNVEQTAVGNIVVEAELGESAPLQFETMEEDEDAVKKTEEEEEEDTAIDSVNESQSMGVCNESGQEEQGDMVEAVTPPPGFEEHTG